MPFLYFLFLITTLFPIPHFANVVGRHVLAEQSATGEVYISTDASTLFSPTVSSPSSVQPSYGRNSSFAISRNTTGVSTLQTFQSSLRGSGAVEPTGPAIATIRTYASGASSSNRATQNKLSVSTGISESSHTSQGSETTIIQTSSAGPNVVILANTNSTLTSILATLSNTNEAFSTTSRQIWSQESAHAQLVHSILSTSNNSAKLGTSVHSAAVSTNGSFTAERKFSSKISSIASTSNTLPAVTPLPGLTGKITTTWTERTSSRTPSRTAARTASAIGNRYPLTTTASAKAATTSIPNLSSKFTGTKTSVGSWPASISFCSLSEGVAVVEVGFVTTFADGQSSITNTSPSQSLIPASSGLGCAGEIAVFSDGLTTTIQLSTLPVATSFPQDGVPIVTQNRAVVQYSPETLSGYDNPQPIKISANFVEVISGHTTTQGGWWLIGACGHIELPKNCLWKTGKGIGCIGGPALCDMPCGVVDVGLDLFVLIDHEDCTPDETDPPGYPGGSVPSIDSDPDLDPPYPQEGEGDDDREKTGDPEKKTATNEEKPTETPQGSTRCRDRRRVHPTEGSRLRSLKISLQSPDLGQVHPTKRRRLRPLKIAL